MNDLTKGREVAEKAFSYLDIFLEENVAVEFEKNLGENWIDQIIKAWKENGKKVPYVPTRNDRRFLLKLFVHSYQTNESKQLFSSIGIEDHIQTALGNLLHRANILGHQDRKFSDKSFITFLCNDICNILNDMGDADHIAKIASFYNEAYDDELSYVTGRGKEMVHAGVSSKSVMLNDASDVNLPGLDEIWYGDFLVWNSRSAYSIPAIHDLSELNFIVAGNIDAIVEKIVAGHSYIQVIGGDLFYNRIAKLLIHKKLQESNYKTPLFCINYSTLDGFFRMNKSKTYKGSIQQELQDSMPDVCHITQAVPVPFGLKFTYGQFLALELPSAQIIEFFHNGQLDYLNDDNATIDLGFLGSNYFRNCRSSIAGSYYELEQAIAAEIMSSLAADMVDPVIDRSMFVQTIALLMEKCPRLFIVSNINVLIDEVAMILSDNVSNFDDSRLNDNTTAHAIEIKMAAKLAHDNQEQGIDKSLDQIEQDLQVDDFLGHITDELTDDFIKSMPVDRNKKLIYIAYFLFEQKSKSANISEKDIGKIADIIKPVFSHQLSIDNFCALRMFRHLTDFDPNGSDRDTLISENREAITSAVKTCFAATDGANKDTTESSSELGNSINERSNLPSVDFYDLKAYLKNNVIGQDKIIDVCVDCIEIDLSPLKKSTKPTSFLFAGTTGSGKTYLAESLARRLGYPFLCLNMSEFMGSDSINRLIGSAPGYHGSMIDAQLVSWVKTHPKSLILFDEIDKAHPEVLNILLQILDKGEFGSARGDKLALNESIVICSTNASQDELYKADNFIGFNKTGSAKADGMRGVQKKFSPELLNRFSEKLIFEKLSFSDVRQIVEIALQRQFADWQENLNLVITATENALKVLASLSFDVRSGAREVDRVIDKAIRKKVIELLKPDYENKRVVITSYVDVSEKMDESVLFDSLKYEVKQMNQ